MHHFRGMSTTTQLPRRFGIVVAIDRSEYAEIVLEHAIDQAARHDICDLHMLTVVTDGSDLELAKQRLGALVLPALDELHDDWRARLHVRRGQTDEEIANLAAELRADLIVIGRFGLHHSGTRLGSVASRVLDAATCPTLVVGLTDDSPDAITACPDCVTVRAESGGERWFCAAHSAPDREVFATSFVSAANWTGSAQMW
jgi:nucleotide-binding universal stress UspA family protein